MQSPSPAESRLAVALALVAACCALAVAATNPGLVRFKPFGIADFLQLVTSLLLVALFIERVLEVFLTSWRGEAAARLKREADTAANASTPEARPSEPEHRLVQYKAQTQRVAFFAGTTLGIVVAALGIRSLELLVEPVAFESLSQVQRRLFRAGDVLLTGAVLGGGSDALHRVVAVFTSIVDWAGDRTKARRPVGDAGL